MGTSLIPAFWIRTSTITTTNPSFNDGYFIRLYSSKAALYKVAGGVMTELSSSVNLGSITDRWWHLKISTYDNVIQAWYTQEESFTDQPQFSYIDLHHYLLEKQLFQQEQLCQELNMLLILIK
ncbi:MAG: hypothetical protein JXA54_13055 [Candidatus Heimdallarchaeota archaeon]|nr:hypothetical protein [Candidatus Heimdallarchaeota archaeon]